ncbi:NAD(P)H-hydrate dehydratase [Maliponia aquimaris]|nr:NAD(P)H-hydrate dehydratase [Maliponia aquimaris]
MRAAEQAAMAGGGVTGLDLMERAGAGVVAAALAEWPDLEEGAQRAVVLCGPGNNGGDGFVIARLLHARGWRVDVFLLGDAERLPPDARHNFLRWQEIGQVDPLTDDALDRFAGAEGVALVVDALFGTGLTRPFLDLGAVRGRLAAWQAAAQPRIVAVDVPSGLCSDSGRYLGHDDSAALDTAIKADLTVSFHSAKPGHYLAQGPEGCGKLVVCDIGLDRAEAPTWLAQAPLAGRLSKAGPSHKYAHGHAVVLSGPPGKGGAARLAARGALRVGAGLVTVGCPLRAVAEHAGRLDAIMVHGLDGTAGLAEMLEDMRYTGLCLGPGLGLGPATGELVRTALAARRGTVLDADALSRFQRDPAVLFGMLHEACVLTPHMGEFARLFPDLAEQLRAEATRGPAFSKVDACRAAAARAGCVVLLKGRDTVIAAPDGQVAIHAAAYERAAPWLATAGAGDVLAGMICGLLARGVDPLGAAVTAAWLHVEAARSYGPGLIAEDLPEALPRVFRGMGL